MYGLYLIIWMIKYFQVFILFTFYLFFVYFIFLYYVFLIILHLSPFKMDIVECKLYGNYFLNL